MRFKFNFRAAAHLHQATWADRVRSWSPQTSVWLAVLSALIAAIAAAGTVYQGWIAREHNKLSLRPKLRLEVKFQENRRGIYIANVGLGTGELTAFTVRESGLNLDLLKEGSHHAFIKWLDVPVRCFLDTQPELGNSVKAGDAEPLLVVTSQPEPKLCEALTVLALMRKSFEVEVHYSSLYEEQLSMKQIIKIDPRAFSERPPGPGLRPEPAP
jgi:hypothetical protein